MQWTTLPPVFGAMYYTPEPFSQTFFDSEVTFPINCLSNTIYSILTNTILSILTITIHSILPTTTILPLVFPPYLLSLFPPYYLLPLFTPYYLVPLFAPYHYLLLLLAPYLLSILVPYLLSLFAPYNLLRTYSSLRHPLSLYLLQDLLLH